MEEYKNTYNTIKKVYDEINKSDINVYMIGGISAAIQANIKLYRQNSDIDLMVEKKDLDVLIQALKNIGYQVEDRRGILTTNFIDEKGTFHPIGHDLDANIKSSDMLGVGIFVFEREEGTIIRTSYTYDEREKSIIGWQRKIPEELFDLVYSNDSIEYAGTQVRCQTKEYTYFTKSNGKRDKDKLDASVIEEYIGIEEQRKVERIRTLQKRTKEYKIIYDKDGNIVSSEKQPEIEDKIGSFISQIVQTHKGISNQEIKQIVLNDEIVKSYMEKDEDVNTIMNLWKESQTEGDIAEVAKNIAHEYFYTDKPYIISPNSLGKISINTPTSESDRQSQKVKRKLDERILGKEAYDKETLSIND